jgi:hypothetical protein
MAVALRETNGFAELKQVLASLQLRGGEQEFARVAAAFLKRHGDRFKPHARPEPLSAAESAALERVGVASSPENPDATPLLKATANHAALVSTALPLAETALRLGVTDGRLRQRVREGSLLAVRAPDGRSLRVPVFQLTGTGELPGLRAVMRAIRRDLPPIQVAAFFSTPQSDLEDADGAPMTPIDWLLAGNDPVSVRDLAQGL